MLSTYPCNFHQLIVVIMPIKERLLAEYHSCRQTINDSFKQLATKSDLKRMAFCADMSA